MNLFGCHLFIEVAMTADTSRVKRYIGV